MSRKYICPKCGKPEVEINDDILAKCNECNFQEYVEDFLENNLSYDYDSYFYSCSSDEYLLY